MPAIPMNLKRAALVGVFGGALAVWIAAAATSPSRPAPMPATPRAAAIDASGEALAVEVARLHERLRPTVAPMQARDLFRYASRPRALDPRRVDVDAAPVESAAQIAPRLTLAGIAEDVGEQGPIRTAIISSPGAVFLVKEGETVLSRYRVTRVSSDAVDLVDADETVLHLLLP